MIISTFRYMALKQNSTLNLYSAQVYALLQQISTVTWQHNKRSMNTTADALANHAMNAESSRAFNTQSPHWTWWKIQLHESLQHDHPFVVHLSFVDY